METEENMFPTSKEISFEKSNPIADDDYLEDLTLIFMGIECGRLNSIQKIIQISGLFDNIAL